VDIRAGEDETERALVLAVTVIIGVGDTRLMRMTLAPAANLANCPNVSLRFGGLARVKPQ
jgi:hypothetical protein